MVVGWLTKLTVTLAVLGVLLFDASTLLVGRVQVADQADTAAQAAADSWRQLHSYQAALLAAQSSAGSDEVVPDSLVIAADGSTTLGLHRDLATLVLHRIPRVAKLDSVIETGTARPPLS